MFDQWTQASRVAVRLALSEAHALGSHRIEPEHLLIALGDRSVRSGVADALMQFDLGQDRVRELVRAERSRSLASAGITAQPAVPTKGDLELSTASKTVLRRAVASSRHGVKEVELLRAILEQQTGTVSRMLAMAGVDKQVLLDALARVEQ